MTLVADGTQAKYSIALLDTYAVIVQELHQINVACLLLVKSVALILVAKAAIYVTHTQVYAENPKRLRVVLLQRAALMDFVV